MENKEIHMTDQEVFGPCLACSAGDKFPKKCQRDGPVVLFGQKSEGKVWSCRFFGSHYREDRWSCLYR